jgi:hypothetical protein
VHIIVDDHVTFKRMVEISGSRIHAFDQVTDKMWPGVVAVPEMSTGATNGRYLRAAGIPTYGIQGFLWTATMCVLMGVMNGCWCNRFMKARHSCTSS